LIVVTHRIAGITFRTESEVSLPRLQEDPFERFRVGDDIVPDVCHRIRQLVVDYPSTPGLTGKEIEQLSARAHCSPGVLESLISRSSQVSDILRIWLTRSEQAYISLARDVVAIRNFVRAEFDIFYFPEWGQYGPEIAVASHFRPIFSSFLPIFSALLIHSSGIVRNNVTALFLAPNSGGKTTIVGHAGGEPILNEDQIVLRKEGDKFIAHGTPLAFGTSGPCQARVGGLFVLDKAEHFKLMPLAPADLVQVLWTEHINYTFFLPKHLKIRAFNLLYDICHQAPCYRMSFPRDCVDWDAIDAAMK